MNELPAPSDECTGAPEAADGSYVAIKARIFTGLIIPILFGGFVAGTLDIGAASLINGTKPGRILQVIASGLLGKSALADDWTVELGLGLQWAMSIFIALIFVFATRWQPALKRHWLLGGLTYGLVIFFVMNYVVLPLSAIGHPPRFRLVHFIEDIIAMLAFGSIIAFFTRERPNRRVREADWKRETSISAAKVFVVSSWFRQVHRWVSIVFTATVIANFAAMTKGTPPPWVTYSPLLPLALLLLSGLYLFALPYRMKWRSRNEA